MSDLQKDWRLEARSQRPGLTAAAADLGLYPATTTYYAAMRAAGWTHVSAVERAVATGLFRAAKPAKSGNRRIEVESMIEAGIALDAIIAAELHYVQMNREGYKRRKGRAAGGEQS